MNALVPLVVPVDIRKRIERELNSLPAIYGKVMLQLIFNCGTSRTIGSVKILTSKEEEIRP